MATNTYTPSEAERAAAPGEDLELLTKGSALTKGPCRALLVGTAGTANITTRMGTTLTNVPLQLGWNPIGIDSIQAGGTADNIWAVY